MSSIAASVTTVDVLLDSASKVVVESLTAVLGNAGLGLCSALGTSTQTTVYKDIQTACFFYSIKVLPFCKCSIKVKFSIPPFAWWPEVRICETGLLFCQRWYRFTASTPMLYSRPSTAQSAVLMKRLRGRGRFLRRKNAASTPMRAIPTVALIRVTFTGGVSFGSILIGAQFELWVKKTEG